MTALITGLPALTVRLGGDDLPPTANLGPVRIRREASRPAACDIEVDASVTVSPGDTLTLNAAGTRLFTGEVAAVERLLGPDRQSRLRVLGFDRADRLRHRTDVTAHTDLTVAGLARALATHAGLGVDAREEGPRRGVLLQAGETDLALLNRCCAAAGLWWRVDDDSLCLRGSDPDPVRTVAWGDDLIEAVLGHETDAPDASVRTVSWDPATRRGVEASSGPGTTRTVVAPLLCDAGEADAFARSLTGRASASTRYVRAVLRGSADWQPGVGLRIAEDPGDVTYLLVTTEHVIDAVSGWVTLVDSRPTPQPESTPSGMTMLPGVVHDVDDPDRAGRVRVRFEVLDDLQSDWLPVLGLGASPAKGFVCQPDVGDTVAVLQPADAPGHGIVLGGIHVDAADDAAGVRSGSVRGLALATADGQRLALDRDTDGALLRNSHGSRLEITESGVVLHAEADLTIAAPGRRLLIRADTVDFERG